MSMSLPLSRALALAAAVLLLALLADARRPPRPPPRRPAPVYDSYEAPSSDQHAAASGHGHHGRVQIKVYRGPDDHHHHAPHGYWVKQPADDAPHHRR
ncbi:hypothetical protein ONE63_004724 [Megalurothrips usitatus]|uniref:Uncharacterized protein n=1 Tax=Megalurothrips usitatus TaxID=439358 RepID=A0AAV7X4F3_9NEOP|nr:hypothetical protein ONE63_004724 [Megalurothrips usitatus]